MGDDPWARKNNGAYKITDETSGKREYRLHASHVKRTVPLCSISKA